MLLSLGVVGLDSGFGRFCLCGGSDDLFDGVLFVLVGVETVIFDEMLAKQLNPNKVTGFRSWVM